ncbi:MAG TPA: hypothetical protein VHG93_00935 [Longimicrobium sp.]|nr:hypothetical protein [Longimicrobium sp.]
MIRIARSAALSAVALLAACADAPTAPRAAAEILTPALNTYPAPVLSVSNSGGYPLISWSALSGATSYSVALTVTTTETNRQTGESSSDYDEYPLGSTTGTSYLDSAHAYLGQSMCTYLNYPVVYREIWRYKVTATFSGGTSSSTVAAPVMQC